ncbi:hypothetical protein [Leptothoe kymatousa]|uniref:Uncharacterized protein n=1 Tax=Leptothoe kymatousa TAU-MAC 1615 TaxID=2364775 RepID=A0ABS5Y643_9CYAN|nr:hypothetical protein [Leptothoe kymatousa]MBT9313308.1 hypothetical protein [Leptothoe kymatousa TAU-MAC 1615]
MVAKLYFSNTRWMLALATGLMVLSAACHSPSSTNQVPSLISLPKSTVPIEALKQPQRVERSVNLMGTVTQKLAIVNGWLYQVDDGTGQVWISTQEVAPVVGNQVHIKGVVRYQPVEVNGADLGDYYLEEKQRQLQPDGAAAEEPEN